MKTVYIAGPYTHPDPVENTNKAIRVGDYLRELGYTPYIPHLSLLWHMVCPHEPDYWYKYDLEWLAKCDCLLRLSGESWGADQEVNFAFEHRIPIFQSVDEVVAWANALPYVVVPVPDSPDD